MPSMYIDLSVQSLAQHQLRHRSLECIIKTGPTIENSATHHQAINEHCRRNYKPPASQSICQIEVCGIRRAKFLRFELCVFRLRRDPASARLPIILKNSTPQTPES